MVAGDVATSGVSWPAAKTSTAVWCATQMPVGARVGLGCRQQQERTEGQRGQGRQIEMGTTRDAQQATAQSRGRVRRCESGEKQGGLVEFAGVDDAWARREDGTDDVRVSTLEQSQKAKKPRPRPI
jgi:hypothetical protein